MGCKGKKRREKNYRKAHGGFNKLPPPPDHSKLHALPSKLRQIMSFTSPSIPSQESVKGVKNETARHKRKDVGDIENKLHSEDDMKDGDESEHKSEVQNTNSGDENVQSGESEKRKKKRKRKPVEDLRFEADLENKGGGSRKKERKKKLLEERKKKHKKTKTYEKVDFPGHEKIKFGDVVEAPPKLVAVPKAPKSFQDASRERLRLQAVEAYRNRNKWTSRPGLKLSAPVTTSLL